MKRSLRWLLAIVIGLVILIGLYIRFEYTLVPEIREFFAGADNKQNAELGELLFATRGCTGCHTLTGVSASSIGPDLSGISQRSSAEQIRRSITQPDAEISQACPGGECQAGLMPAYEDILDADELDALVEYLQSHAADER